MEIKTTLRHIDSYQQKLDKAEPENKIKRDKTSQISNGLDTDRVSLSDEARLRTEAFRVAQNTDEVRSDKIARIKAQIADGTYQIDTQKIAQNLVRDDLDLLL